MNAARYCTAYAVLSVFFLAVGMVPAAAQTYVAIDLNPNFSGLGKSQAHAVSGSTEVGFGSGTGGSSKGHALLWSGTADSAIDLNRFLPSGYNTDSRALAINSTGDVVGWGSGTKGLHAFLWRLVTKPHP
jgi:hypothetical protein